MKKYIEFKIIVLRTANRVLFQENRLAELTKLVLNINKKAKVVTRSSLAIFFKNGGILALATVKKSGYLNKVVGTASLVPCFKVNACSYRLEHVSVLSDYSGQGMGKALVSALKERAAKDSIKRIDLTCEPSRK